MVARGKRCPEKKEVDDEDYKVNLTGGLYIEACLGVSEDSYTSLHSRKKSCALVNKGEPCPTGLNLAFLKKNIAITCQLRNSLRTRGVRDGPTN